MPRDHRKSREEFPIDEGKRLREQGYSYQEIAHTIGWSYGQTYRKLKDLPTNGTRADDIPVDMNGVRIDDISVETVELTPADNNAPTTSLQRVEILGEPVSPESSAVLRSTTQPSHDLTDLAARVARLEAHRVEVGAWIATFQDQLREPAQHHAEVRSAEPRSLARSSAETAQTWDDPDDAKAVPFNCSLPRGLKRLLDAEAKRTGLPASRLVQQLLKAALMGEGGSRDA